MSLSVRPYRSTSIFDQTTLPNALRHRHATKSGVWGVIRVLEGCLRLTYTDTDQEILIDPEHPGLILPEQVHFVTPMGAMRMQVEFYDRLPDVRPH